MCSCGLVWGFPDSSVGKESTCNAGDPGSIPGSGRSAGEGIGDLLQYSWVSLVAQLVNNPPAMWEIWVWSLGWEDSLEKGKATNSSILAWSPWSHKESDTTEWLSLSVFSLDLWRGKVFSVDICKCFLQIQLYGFVFFWNCSRDIDLDSYTYVPNYSIFCAMVVKQFKSK